MIFAGPCLFTDLTESFEIRDTAGALKDIGIDYFRCKIFGGGTRPERYVRGVGVDALTLFDIIRNSIKINVCTEVQTPDQIKNVIGYMDLVWIGARNCQNYGLLEYISNIDSLGYIPFAIKRGPAMPIDEVYGIYDIFQPSYIIERGIITFDPMERSRFAPDLKGVIRIKNERPDIFDKLAVDCSHSVFRKDYVGDVYKAFKAIGVQHFMFECTYTGKSKTDQEHMLSVKELEQIIKD